MRKLVNLSQKIVLIFNQFTGFSLSLCLSVALSLCLNAILRSEAHAQISPNLPERSDRKVIALSIGRIASWPLEPRDQVSLSNGAILRVKDQGNTLKITALKLGSAVVRTQTRELEVLVLPEAAYRQFAALASAIESRRGLSLNAERGKLSISGRLLRAEDWLAVADSVAELKAGVYSFQAQIEDDVRDKVDALLQAKLKAAGLHQVDLRFQPEAVATVGIEPADAKERAEKILGPFGFRVESNSTVLNLEPLVRVKILVAEVSKTFSRKLGLKLPTSISGQLLPKLSFDPNSAPFEILAGEQTGDVKILASPTLLCRSGKEAEFLAGGEFPIKLSSLATAGVTWKKYGVLLKIKPIADRQGRMSIAIETEVSSLKDNGNVEGLPTVLTNRMQTHFDLSQSKTIALSGLIKSENHKDSSGIPGLRDLPILGPLLSSREFSEDRTELLIFVTPDVPSENAAGSF